MSHNVLLLDVESFELRTSQLIAIYRAIIGHYKDNPERQKQEFQELVRELRRAVMTPP